MENKENKNDFKPRRNWELKSKDGYKLASGVLYSEGNVQVLWHADIGWTGIQYSSISYVIDLFPHGTTLEFDPISILI